MLAGLCMLCVRGVGVPRVKQRLGLANNLRVVCVRVCVRGRVPMLIWGEA